MMRTIAAFALLVAAFGCATAPESPSPGIPDPAIGACRMQEGVAVPANALKAVGTEPFWSAMIDGRCVTYSTPENPQGERIWTKFTGSAENGEWTGGWENMEFVLATRPEPGCSDGMSDRTFPIAVTLTIGTEVRRGCAEPR